MHRRQSCPRYHQSHPHNCHANQRQHDLHQGPSVRATSLLSLQIANTFWPTYADDSRVSTSEQGRCMVGCGQTWCSSGTQAPIATTSRQRHLGLLLKHKIALSPLQGHQPSCLDQFCNAGVNRVSRGRGTKCPDLLAGKAPHIVVYWIHKRNTDVDSNNIGPWNHKMVWRHHLSSAGEEHE